MFKDFIFDLQRFEDIYNDENNIFVSGTSNNDFIHNGAADDYNEENYSDKGSGVTIDAGKGDDYIENYGASNVSIFGGAGNDDIYNQSVVYHYYELKNEDGEWSEDGEWEEVEEDIMPGYSTLYGGSGHDYIYNEGFYVTINGGKGNDTISLGYANLIQYKSGDGKDLIQGFNADDTLSISGGTYSTQESDAAIPVSACPNVS